MNASEEAWEVTDMALQRNHDVAAMDEVYKAGRRDADKAQVELESERIDCEAVGKIKAANFNIKTNELLKYVTLFQIKKGKEYRKTGRTWEDFCSAIGESQRSVDRVLSELQPILEQISAAQAEILGMPLSKIRFLGRTISATQAEISDNALMIDGNRIEITPENKDELEAAIDALKEAHEKEREGHAVEVAKLKKKLDGAATEETKALKAEKDALVREVNRLKVFDPEDKDVSWSVDQMKGVMGSCAEFVVNCRKFVIDERLDSHIELQAEVEGLITRAQLALGELSSLWNERFGQFGE